ncbi:MAG: YraN family protein [Patescibacteria group bacterium]
MKQSDSKQNIGRLGEDVACDYLENKGFKILDRNYRKFFGEIDVIAQKSKKLHFVEVKTVSRENLENVNHETNNYRPEENVHPWKLKRIFKTIETYLLEKNISEKVEWVFDVAAVYLDVKGGKAKVDFLEDIVV